jgi:hypothetical protein
MLCAAGTKSSTITKLKDYEKGPLEPTILQAALATSGDPGIFSTVDINTYKLLFKRRGGNNPIYELINEAKLIWNIQGDDDLIARLGCIVSVGAGPLNTDMALRDKRFRFLTQELKDMEENTAKLLTEKEFSRRGKLYKAKSYRFEVEKAFRNVGLFEHNKKKKIEQETEAYLRHGSNEVLVNKCANIIGDGVSMSEIRMSLKLVRLGSLQQLTSHQDSLIKKGQTAWDEPDESERVPKSVPHFMKARRMLRHYRKRSQLYSSPLVKVSLCMAHNYYIAGIKNGGSSEGDRLLRRAKECLDEAESEAESEAQRRADPKLEIAVSISRLQLEAAAPRMKLERSSIDRETAAGLLERAGEIQQRLNSLAHDADSEAEGKRLAVLIDVLKNVDE